MTEDKERTARRAAAFKIWVYVSAALVLVAAAALGAGIYLVMKKGEFAAIAESLQMTPGKVMVALSVILVMMLGAVVFSVTRLAWRFIPAFAASPVVLLLGIFAEPRDLPLVKVASFGFMGVAILCWLLGTLTYYHDLNS